MLLLFILLLLLLILLLLSLLLFVIGFGCWSLDSSPFNKDDYTEDLGADFSNLRKLKRILLWGHEWFWILVGSYQSVSFFYIQGDGTDEVGTDYANLGESKRI